LCINRMDEYISPPAPAAVLRVAAPAALKAAWAQIMRPAPKAAEIIPERPLQPLFTRSAIKASVEKKLSSLHLDPHVVQWDDTILPKFEGHIVCALTCFRPGADFMARGRGEWLHGIGCWSQGEVIEKWLWPVIKEQHATRGVQLGIKKQFPELLD
jgi:hypothetical protein